MNIDFLYYVILLIVFICTTSIISKQLYHILVAIKEKPIATIQQMDNKELEAIKFYFELLINHLNIDINSLLTKEMKKIKENDKIMLALSNGKKIEEIKLYREISGLGLKEAKNTIEYLMKFKDIK